MTVAVPQVCRDHPLGCASVRGLERVVDALAPYPLWVLIGIAAFAGLLLTVVVVHLRERFAGRPHRHSLASKLGIALGLPLALVVMFVTGHYLVELTAPALWLIDRSPAVPMIAVSVPLALLGLAWARWRAKYPYQRVRDYPYSRWRALRVTLDIESTKDLWVTLLMVAMIAWATYSVSTRLTACVVGVFNTRPERIVVDVTAQRSRRNDTYIDVAWPGRRHDRLYWPKAWFRPLPDRCVFHAAQPGDRLLLQGRRGWAGFSVERVLPLDPRLREACADGSR